MSKPLVSVIMPVRNGEKFVSEAIESIMAQTYQDFELFIVNDNSLDLTGAIIDGYQKKCPEKIRVIHLKKRQGAYGAMNIAMKYIKGEYIAPMDSDDIAHRQRLEKEVEFLTNNPETIVVGSWVRIIDKNRNVVGTKTFGTTHKEIYSSFFTVHPLVHPSCMIRRGMLSQRDKLYWNKFGVNDDYYTFFTLLPLGKFSNIPEYLLDYRIHLDNSSLQNIKDKFFNTVKIRFEAVRYFGYKPGIVDLCKFFMQIFFVSLTPEKLLLAIYLYIKGIYNLNSINIFKGTNILTSRLRIVPLKRV